MPTDHRLSSLTLLAFSNIAQLLSAILKMLLLPLYRETADAWDLAHQLFSIRENSFVCALLNTSCFTSAGSQVLQADGRAAAEQGSAGSQAMHPPQAVEERLQEGSQPLDLQRISTQKALHETKYMICLQMCSQLKRTFEDPIKERHLVTFLAAH